MAEGFKVADAYVLVRTEDNTRAGRDKIDRDTTKWSEQLGDKAGNNIARGIGAGLLRGLRALLSTLLRFTLISSLIGLIGAAVAALSGYVVQLYGALAVLVQTLWASLGVMTLIPGAIFTLIAAIATLKIGFSGLGAALKAGLSGDLAAFEEQLKKLAPAVQELARAIVALKPAWDALRLSVQQTLFQDITPMFQQLAGVYIPLLERGLGNVATGLNAVFQSVIRSLLDPYTSRNVEATLGSVGRILENLAVGLEPLLTALSQVISISSGILADMSERWGAVMKGWADTLTAIPEDQWQAWVDGGIAALKQLGNLVGSLIGILTGLAKAAGDSDIFGFFRRISDWINSLKGQQVLSQVFQALRVAAEALSPVLFTLGEVLGNVLTAFSAVMVMIGPTLQQVVGAIDDLIVPLAGPVAQAIGAIGGILVGLARGIGPGLAVTLQAMATALAHLIPIAEPLGRAIGDLLIAISPLIPVVGRLLAAGLGGLAQVLTGIAVAITPLIELVAELGMAFIDELLGASEEGATWFERMVVLFERALTALEPLIPPMVQFVQEGLAKLLTVLIELQPLLQGAFLLFVEQLLRALPGLLREFIPLVPVLAEVATILASEMVNALRDLAPHIPALVVGLVQLAIAGTEFLIALTPLLPILGQLAIMFIRDMLPAIIMLLPVMTSIITTVALLVRAFIDLSSTIGRKAGEIVGFLVGLPGQILGFFMSLPGHLVQIGQAIIDGLIRGISNRIGQLQGLLRWITSVIPSWKGPLDTDRRLLIASGQATLAGYIEGIRSKVPLLESVLSQLTGSIPGLVGAVPAPAGPGGAFGQPPQVNVAVQIGERPVREMVRAEIVESPDAVSASAREGDRRNAVADPSRRRVGVRP